MKDLSIIVHNAEYYGTHIDGYHWYKTMFWYIKKWWECYFRYGLDNLYGKSKFNEDIDKDLVFNSYVRKQLPYFEDFSLD